MPPGTEARLVHWLCELHPATVFVYGLNPIVEERMLKENCEH